MSYDPNDTGLQQVNFLDEDHAAEDGDLQVDFAPRLSHHDGDDYGEDRDSEAFIDQIDVELDNIPRQRQGNSLLKVGVILLLVGALFGTVSYFVFSPSGDDGDGGSSSSNTRVSSTFLTPPPANLAAKCSTTDGDDCRQACEPAECCDFPANLALSCLAGHEKECLTYHQFCSILTGSAVLPAESATLFPPAPSNLKELCTVEKTATVDGFQECQEACQPAACCYSDSDTCTNAACADYAACLIPAASDHVHEDIAPHVEAECSDLDTTTGRSNCRVACSHALCCFTSDDPAQTSTTDCPHPDDSFCAQYSICNELEGNVNIKSSLEEVNQICTKTTHTKLCEVVCERGACCFASERCPTDDIVCSDYTIGCAVIYGDTRDDDAVDDGDDTGGSDTGGSDTGGSDEDPSEDENEIGITLKVDVDDACFGFDPAQANAATSECAKLCEDVGCCFETSGCSAASKINCQTYEECDIIYGGDPVGEDSEDDLGIVFKVDVDDACTEFDPAQANAAQSECTKLCENAGCCFETSGCPATSKINCQTYEECDIIYEKDDVDDSEDDLGIVLKVDVDDACTGFDPAQANAADSECAKLCENVGCCFETGGCSTGINCNTYDECDIIYGEESDGASDDEDPPSSGGGGSGSNKHNEATAEEIYEACEDHDLEVIQIPDMPSLCQLMCDQYACCFEDCSAPSDVVCDTGASCHRLFKSDSGGGSNTAGGGSSGDTGGTTGNTDEASAIYDACKNHNEEVVQVPGMPTLCENLCEKYQCCFDVNNCDVPASIECSLGTDCKVVHSDTSGGADPNPSGGGEVSALSEACEGHNDELISEPGKPTLCQQMCEQYKCCDSSNGCEVPAGTDCADGIICDTVGGHADTDTADSDEEVVPTDASLYDEIMAACEEGSDRGQCESLCDAGRCCFESQSCETASDIECDEFEGCLVVFAVDGEDEVPAPGDGVDANEFKKEDVDAACSGDAVTSMCTKLCDASECCFRTSMSCAPTLDCTTYDSCSNVWGQ